MAMIVEDGTVVANANSYQTEAAFLSYWSDRNITISNTTAEIEAALIIATQYVDLNNTWKGDAVSETQSLDWPRSGAYDKNGFLIDSGVIPDELKNAVNEYAYRQLTSALQPDDSQSQTIVSEKKRLGTLEKEIDYLEEAKKIKLRYPMADNWLRGLTKGGTMGSFGGVSRCY